MEILAPISLKKRRLMLIFAIFSCIIITPILIIYSLGMRISLASGEKVVTPIGGIFVASYTSGSEIYIDGIQYSPTGLFSNNFFINNLNLGNHDISLIKDGYMAWNKKVYVEPYLVTTLNSLMIPSEIFLEEYDDMNIINTIFSSSTETTLLPSIKAPLIYKNNKVWIKGETLFIEWIGKMERIPDSFCKEGKNSCIATTSIKFDEKIISFNFYNDRSDVFILGIKDKLFIVELDDHSNRIIAPIFKGKYKEVNIYDGSIYINTDKKVFKVKNI